MCIVQTEAKRTTVVIKPTIKCRRKNRNAKLHTYLLKHRRERNVGKRAFLWKEAAEMNPAMKNKLFNRENKEQLWKDGGKPTLAGEKKNEQVSIWTQKKIFAVITERLH